MAPRHEVTLYAPHGGSQRKVTASGPLHAQLLAAGWSQFPPGTKPPPVSAADLASMTARRAREDLATLTPEAWVRDWGLVLTQALEDAEKAREALIAKDVTLTDIVLAAMDAMRAITNGVGSWTIRTGWSAGMPALSPTAERQGASEDLVRMALEAAGTYQARIKPLLAALQATDQAPAMLAAGNPVAREAALGMLAKMEAKMKAEKGLPPEAHATLLETMRGAIDAVIGPGAVVVEPKSGPVVIGGEDNEDGEEPEAIWVDKEEVPS